MGSAQQLSVDKRRLVLQARNKYTDGKGIKPQAHGILDIRRSQDEMPEEEELEFGAISTMMMISCIIIWCMYKQNRGENVVASLCGNWALSKTAGGREMEERYQADSEYAGGEHLDDLMLEEDE